MNKYLKENQGDLVVFEKMMSNTKNANGANYYIYDYLVNPIKVTNETGKSIIKEKEDTSYKWIILIIFTLVLLILGVVYLFYIGKKEE